MSIFGRDITPKTTVVLMNVGGGVDAVGNKMLVNAVGRHDLTEWEQ